MTSPHLQITRYKYGSMVTATIVAPGLRETLGRWGSVEYRRALQVAKILNLPVVYTKRSAVRSK